MRNTTLLTSVIGLALLFVILTVSAPYCFSQNRGGKAPADDAALLQQHDEAMNKHDMAGIVALYAPGNETLILGTGPGERYQDPAEY